MLYPRRNERKTNHPTPSNHNLLGCQSSEEEKKAPSTKMELWVQHSSFFFSDRRLDDHHHPLWCLPLFLSFPFLSFPWCTAGWLCARAVKVLTVSSPPRLDYTCHVPMRRYFVGRKREEREEEEKWLPFTDNFQKASRSFSISYKTSEGKGTEKKSSEFFVPLLLGSPREQRREGGREKGRGSMTTHIFHALGVAPKKEPRLGGGGKSRGETLFAQDPRKKGLPKGGNKRI